MLRATALNKEIRFAAQIYNKITLRFNLLKDSVYSSEKNSTTRSYALTVCYSQLVAITSCISLSSLILSKNRTICTDIQTTLLNSLLRFGRKSVLFGGTVLLSITNGVLAFAPSWPVFLVLFFMAGVNQMPSYLAGFVLGTFLTIFFSDIVANEPFCTMAVDCALTDYPTGLRWLPSSFPAFSKTERSFLQAQRSWVVFQEFSSPVCACLACTCAVWCCCRPPPTWSDTGGIWRCCWLCRAWPTCRSGGKLISAHYQDSNASQGRLNGKVATKPGSSYSWWHLCSRRNLGS